MFGYVLKGILATAICGMVPPLVGAAENVETAAYQRLCAECHPRAERLASRFDAAEPAATETRWHAFLMRHHAPEEPDRAILIRHFRTLRAGR